MATSGMDALSKELHDFLCRLGEHPEQVSDKLQGYTQALLQLLTPADELLVKGRYGILGSTKESIAQLAIRFNTDENTVEAVLQQCLRKIAVTPEWQDIKALTQLKAIRLK